MPRKKEKAEFSTRTRIPKSQPEYKFGTRLKNEMKKKGMKAAQLADKMGVSIDTVNDWRQHYTFPNEMNLGELCRIFAPCSVDYFHGNIDEPSYDVKFIMEYTGLSADAVERLHKLKYDIDFDKREEERDRELYLEAVKKNPKSGGYVLESDPEEVKARDKAKLKMQLLDTMLDEDELLSLMSMYVYGDIQTIAYYNSERKLKQDILAGYIIAHDTVSEGYRIKTASLIRPHLADRIIDCLKKYANDNEDTVQRIRPEIQGGGLIDV